MQQQLTPKRAHWAQLPPLPLVSLLEPTSWPQAHSPAGQWTRRALSGLQWWAATSTTTGSIGLGLSSAGAWPDWSMQMCSCNINMFPCPLTTKLGEEILVLLNPFVIKEEILIYFPFLFLFLFLSVWVSWSVQKKRFGFHGVFHVVDLVVECCFFSSKRDARSWWNSTTFLSF